MPTSSYPRELFRQPDTEDWLSFLQFRLEAQDLAANEALALTGVIHARLRRHADQTSLIYLRYARLMALLQYGLPDAYEYVITNWHLPSVTAPEPLPEFLTASEKVDSTEISPATDTQAVG